MTAAQIDQAQKQANIPFTIAKQIRELIDAARKEYGAKEFDESDVETQILELVTGEP